MNLRRRPPRDTNDDEPTNEVDPNTTYTVTGNNNAYIHTSGLLASVQLTSASNIRVSRINSNNRSVSNFVIPEHTYPESSERGNTVWTYPGGSNNHIINAIPLRERRHITITARSNDPATYEWTWTGDSSIKVIKTVYDNNRVIERSDSDILITESLSSFDDVALGITVEIHRRDPIGNDTEYAPTIDEPIQIEEDKIQKLENQVSMLTDALSHLLKNNCSEEACKTILNDFKYMYITEEK